jgi:hypothetical protein
MFFKFHGFVEKLSSWMPPEFFCDLSAYFEEFRLV